MDFQRLLFRFSKEGEARYLSHHDLMRLFERALRRAALSVRMTQGFNPHPKLAILLALPLGIEADEEAMEIEFQPPVAPADALEGLRAQMPKGIGIRSAEALPQGARAHVASVTYRAELPPGLAVGPEEAEGLLRRTSALVERTTPSGTRTVDIRPALDSMTLDGGTLTFTLRVAPSGVPKPTEVVAAVLGRPASSAHDVRLRRTRLNLILPAPREPADLPPGHG